MHLNVFALSILADSPSFFCTLLFHSPFFFLYLLCVYVFCVCARMWLRGIWRLVWRHNVLRSVLQHRSRLLFTEVHGKAHKEEGRKCGCTSIKSLVCPLWCYAAMHFSYKEKVLLSLRIEVKDTELFPELSTPHHNITGTRSPRRAVWCVCAQLAVSLAGVIFHAEGIASNIMIKEHGFPFILICIYLFILSLYILQ